MHPRPYIDAAGMSTAALPFDEHIGLKHPPSGPLPPMPFSSNKLFGPHVSDPVGKYGLGGRNAQTQLGMKIYG